MASITDRWVRKDRTRTERYGQGLRWLVEWQDRGGSRRRKSFATKDAAAAHVLKVQVEVSEGVYTAPARPLMVREYAVTWMGQQIHQRASSRQTIHNRVNRNIIPVLGDLQLVRVTRQDVQAAVLEWDRSLAPSTVKTTYTYLAGMMKSAVLDGLIRVSPCAGIRLPKVEAERVRPLTTETVQRIVELIWNPYKEFVVFGAATGMRGAEMRGLTWDRVNLAKGLVTVDRQLVGTKAGTPLWGPPKTASSVRTITIGAHTTATLEGMRRDGPLVFHREGRPIMRNTASMAWAAVREKVPGIGGGYHQLRHYAASLWISGGMSPVAVANRLGHKDATETLQVYGHIWEGDDMRAAELSDGLITLGVRDETLPPPSFPPVKQ